MRVQNEESVQKKTFCWALGKSSILNTLSTACLNSFYILFSAISLPHTLFNLILRNDSFVVKIISGRENEAIHKFILPHSSKPVKSSHLFRKNDSHGTIFQEKYLQKLQLYSLHSSVPIPGCCLSCSYESILRKKLRRGIC